MEPSDAFVADVNFCFKQSEVIDALKLRAKAIEDKRQTLAQIYSKKLFEILRDGRRDEQRTYSAFVTFETEAAVRKVRELESLEFLGQRSKFSEPVDPTDIIWEHRWIKNS